MARIKNIELPKEKSIQTGLTAIYGIGRSLAKTICDNAKVDFEKKVKDHVAYDFSDDVFSWLNEATDDSYLNKMGEKGQTIVRGVHEAVGAMLPSVIAAIATSGGSTPQLVSQIASLGTMFVGAAGQSTEEAIHEGADLGKATAYGIASGAAEAALEKVGGYVPWDDIAKTGGKVFGKEIAKSLKESLAAKVVELNEKYGRTPNLVVILVGDDPGSVSYVTGKAKAADEVGIDNSTIRLSEQTTEDELLDLVRALNVDTTVDGILVQLPLPNGINEEKVIETIAKEKDVDGFHPMNVAALWQKRPCVLPCTPKGIIELLDQAGVEIAGKKAVVIGRSNIGIEIAGKRAVVIGRSNIVGLPVTKLLMDENATVTVCHSRTKDIAKVCSEADILVPALGRPKFVKAEMVKEGAVVIDVGVNRDPETGKLCGDVDFDEVAPKASYITKVPGGVGPMTIACLMENTVECYLNNVKAQAK